nr:AAA domain protein [uncultured bacterium]
MSLVLGVIGERSSGKDTLSQYLVEKYRAFAISHSKILDEILNILDLPISRRNEIDLGMALRSPFGEGVIAKALRKRVLQETADIIVVQSIRFPHEVDNVKTLHGHLIFIEAPLKVRYERAHKRQEKADDNISFEQFQAMQQEPTEIGIEALKKDAEFVISNDSTLEHLYQQIDEVMHKLGKDKK